MKGDFRFVSVLSFWMKGDSFFVSVLLDEKRFLFKNVCYCNRDYWIVSVLLVGYRVRFRITDGKKLYVFY